MEKMDADVRRGGVFTRRRFIQGIGVALAGGVGTYGYATTIAVHDLKIEQVQVSIPRLAARWQGRRIVLLADLHAGPRVSPAYLERAIHMAADLKPDFLVIAGDFVDSAQTNIEEIARILSPVTEKVVTYGSTGNHDFGPGFRSQAFCATVTELLGKAGVRMLRNDFHQPCEGSGELCFVGLDDLWSNQMDPSVLDRVPRDAAVILLSHNPDSYEEVARYQWDVMLSGHTHGGQVCIPGIGPILLPVRHRERAAGLFHLDSARPHRALYVTRGVGHLRKVRFFCPPEITCITLKAAEN